MTNSVNNDYLKNTANEELYYKTWLSHSRQWNPLYMHSFFFKNMSLSLIIIKSLNEKSCRNQFIAKVLTVNKWQKVTHEGYSWGSAIWQTVTLLVVIIIWCMKLNYISPVSFGNKQRISLSETRNIKASFSF